MVREIAFYLIFGKPLIMYGGIITGASIFFTAYIGYSISKGKIGFSVKSHIVMARISLALMLLHGILGVLIFF